MYTNEWRKAAALRAELESLIRDLSELRPEYEPFQGLIINLLLGEVPAITVECDGNPCRVEAKDTIGGLWYYLEELKKVLEALELEIDYEGDEEGEEETQEDQSQSQEG